MDLFEKETLSSVPGSFGMKIEGESQKRLAVPSELFSILVAMRIETAEGFYKALYKRDTQDHIQASLEKALSWTVTDFMKAAAELGPLLDGHVSDWLLYPYGKFQSKKGEDEEQRLKKKRICVPI